MPSAGPAILLFQERMHGALMNGDGGGTSRKRAVIHDR
jgi:hypothetical protein